MSYSNKKSVILSDGIISIKFDCIVSLAKLVNGYYVFNQYKSLKNVLNQLTTTSDSKYYVSFLFLVRRWFYKTFITAKVKRGIRYHQVQISSNFL